MTILNTKRLTIRHYQEGDLHEMHRLWSDKEIMYYLDDIMTNSLEETKALLESSMKNADGQYFCICNRQSDSFMGGIGYTITADTPLGKIVHLGYMLLPEFWGKGYVTEAVQEIIRFAFEDDDCIRITTGCHKENAASSRVMEKAGFHKEGEGIKAAYHDGVMKDRVEYAITRE